MRLLRKITVILLLSLALLSGCASKDGVSGISSNNNNSAVPTGMEAKKPKEQIIENEKEFILKSERLQVNVLKPGTEYKRDRFDWSGIVKQVKLDDKHTFCTVESSDPAKGTGGIGLCNAFEPPSPMPVYNKLEPDESFVLIGVGLINSVNKKFFNPDKKNEIQPFTFKTKTGSNFVTFTQDAFEYNGYNYKYEKTLEIKDNHLIIKYKLANVGSKELDYVEYAHNFIRIDNNNTGPDYILKLPYTPNLANKSAVLTLEDEGVTWKQNPDKEYLCYIRNYNKEETNYWELVHKPSRVGVRETSNFPISRFNLWGTANVICPEVFYRVKLQPGESVEWSRDYYFFKG